MAIAGVADKVGGAILGIGLGGLQDRRQLKQQGKLQEQQIKGAKELKDYDVKSQMDIWNRTNYGAQMEHMKKAGLNPALMYGQGGGAGGSLGGGGMAMPTEATAEGASQGQGKIMEMAMMQAQIDVMKSQAEKNTVEAEVGKEEIGHVKEKTGAVKLANQWEEIIQGLPDGETHSLKERQFRLVSNKLIADMQRIEAQNNVSNVEALLKKTQEIATGANIKLSSQEWEFLEEMNKLNIEGTQEKLRQMKLEIERYENDPQNTKTIMWINTATGVLGDVAKAVGEVKGVNSKPRETVETIDRTTDKGWSFEERRRR